MQDTASKKKKKLENAIFFKHVWNVPYGLKHTVFKISLSKYKRIEFASSVYSDHNSIKSTTGRKKEKKEYLETKKYFTEMSVGQWWSQRRNKNIYLKTNNDENTLKNLCVAAKAALKGNFIVK